MRITIVHGYFLSDSGSAVYTRELTRELTRAGHEVTLICQEQQPWLYDFIDSVYDLNADNRGITEFERHQPAFIGSCRLVRPGIDGNLLTYVPGPFPGFNATTFQDAGSDQIDSYINANIGALETIFNRWPTDLVQANHAIMQPLVVRRALNSQTAYIVTVHGSELNFSINNDPRLVPLALEGLAGAAAVFALSQASLSELNDFMLANGLDIGSRIMELPPGVDTDLFTPKTFSFDTSDDISSFGDANPRRVVKIFRWFHNNHPRQDNAHWLPAEIIEAPAEIIETPADIIETPAEIIETTEEIIEAYPEIIEEPPKNNEGPAEIIEAPDEIIERPDEPPGEPNYICRLSGEVDGVAVFAGRLLWTKGLQYVLASWPLVLRERPGFHLFVAGEGPMLMPLQALIAAFGEGNHDKALNIINTEPELRSVDDYGDVIPTMDQAARELYLHSALSLHERVHFMGHLGHEQLAKLFAAADISLAPSVFPEAFGLVSIEAMAAGALPVATYQSGLKTPLDATAALLEDNDLMRLRPGKPLGDAIATTVLHIMNVYPTRAPAFRQRLHDLVVRRFSWRVVADKMLEYAQKAE